MNPDNPASPRRLKTSTIILAGVALLVVILGFWLHAGLKSVGRFECQYNLRHVSLWCREYAGKHGGRFPDRWTELSTLEDFSTNWARTVRCPSAGPWDGNWTNIDLWSGYRLLPGRSDTNSPNTVLALDLLSNHENRGAWVLYTDGSIQWRDASWILQDPAAQTH